ncbi:MAG: HAD-IA family hydrolase [Planctomycetes bacterium]|nr:HAD-IA family hydrolase [Planctomycetota bacterium]
MIPASVRAIFFDAVGTMIFPTPPAADVYADIGRRHGSRLPLDVIVTRFRAAFRAEEEFDRRNDLRTDETREVRRWRRIVGAVLDDVADGEAVFGELFEYFSRPSAWRCNPDAGAVLAELARRGYRLGLASNYDGRLRSVAAGLPELRPLEHLVLSSEVGWRKPARGFFEAVVQEAGVPAGHVLFVGDDPVNDGEGARAAGLRVLLLDRCGPYESCIVRLGDLLSKE